MTRYIINTSSNLTGSNAADWFRDKTIFNRRFATDAEASEAAIQNYLGPDVDGNHAEWDVEEIAE